MAGHSKWANIKYRKAGQDALRGKQFTKFIREITSAVRSFGVDPASNPRLRTAIEKALNGNMTREVIDRAIKRAAGGEDDESLEEIRYEGYGINGVAIIVDCLSNNRNRTVADVRHAFTKHGGNLGTTGSVAFMFNKLGQFVLGGESSNDGNIDLAIELGAEDIEQNDDGTVEIKVKPEDFEQLRTKLIENKAELVYAEVTLIPTTYVALNAEDSSSVLKLINVLEELDDVQNVYTNADFS